MASPSPSPSSWRSRGVALSAGTLLLIWLPALTSAATESHEYCEWESFNATCPSPTDEIVLIENAKYGRMNLGRCVTKNYGHIGCGTDVTADFDRACSGRRQCVVPIISLHDKRSCPKDFKSYLEASFTCVKVLPSPGRRCIGNSQGSVVTAETGKIASEMSYGPGSSSSSSQQSRSPCPWTIRVKPYQRINITMTDFAVSPTTDYWYPGVPPPSGSSGSSSSSGECVPYATVSERAVVVGTGGGSGGQAGRNNNSTICGGRHRHQVVYVSTSNEISIQISPLKDRFFLLQYQAFGCPPIATPPNARVKLSGDHAEIQCNFTDEAWYLTCKGTEWLGTVANCTSVAATGSDAEEWSFGVLGGVSNFPFGILIVVALGVAIGVAIGVVMLVAVLAYMRRRRRRKIRSRSQYMLKQVNNVSGMQGQGGEDGDVILKGQDHEPMLLKREQVQQGITRDYIGLSTWQHSRRSLPSPGPGMRLHQSSPGTPTSPAARGPQQHIMQDGILLTELPNSPHRASSATSTLPKSFSTFRPVHHSSTDGTLDPRNAYIISDGGEHGGGNRGGPYYFKLDQGEHNHKPDVVSGHCAVCLAQSRQS